MLEVRGEGRVGQGVQGRVGQGVQRAQGERGQEQQRALDWSGIPDRVDETQGGRDLSRAICTPRQEGERWEVAGDLGSGDDLAIGGGRSGGKRRLGDDDILLRRRRGSS